MWLTLKKTLDIKACMSSLVDDTLYVLSQLLTGRVKPCPCKSPGRQLEAWAWSLLGSFLCTFSLADFNLSSFTVINYNLNNDSFSEFCESLQQIINPRGGLRKPQHSPTFPHAFLLTTWSWSSRKKTAALMCPGRRSYNNFRQFLQLWRGVVHSQAFSGCLIRPQTLLKKPFVERLYINN